MFIFGNLVPIFTDGHSQIVMYLIFRFTEQHITIPVLHIEHIPDEHCRHVCCSSNECLVQQPFSGHYSDGISLGAYDDILRVTGQH